MPRSKAHEKLPDEKTWRASRPEMPRPIPPFESQAWQDYKKSLDDWVEMGRKIELSKIPRTRSVKKKEWNSDLA